MRDDDQMEQEATLTAAEADGVLERLRFFLGQGMAFITDAQSADLAAWQFSFALGTDNCVGHTMTSKAKDLGVTTACLSKGATKVCRMLDIPPSPYMLPKTAVKAYQNLRIEQESQRIEHHVSKKKPK